MMRSYLLLLTAVAVSFSVTQGDVVLEDTLQTLVAEVRSKVADLLTVDPSKAEAVEASGSLDRLAQDLLEWVRSNDKAFVNEKLEIRKSTPSNLHFPHYGLVAALDIAADELLFEIPEEMMLEPTELAIDDRVQVYWNEEEMYSAHITRMHDDGTYDLHFDDDSVHTVDKSLVEHEMFPVNCGTIQRLIDEYKLGEKSRFAPFVQFMMAQPRGQLPSDWSEAGQDLLKLMIGMDNIDHLIEIPPETAFDMMEDDWRFRCGRPVNANSSQAYYSYLQRGIDEVFIPIYDMMRHSNDPNVINVRNGPVRKHKSVKVYASRNIPAGEALHTTYNFCADCESRFKDYGTPQLLRDYGFVESFPQRWVFPDDGLSFDLKEAVDESGRPTGKLNVSYNKKPTSNAVRFMQEQLRRLKDFAEVELMAPDPAIPAHELDTILRYFEATTTALSLAIQAGPSSKTKDCSADNTCDLHRNDRYESLYPKSETWIDERPATCNSKREYAFNSWHILEEVNSRYQDVTFSVNPDINDMCFDLDNVVQICSSYRPHYHEMMVHFTARYLDEVKRVVFVGGGDSMLLHEIIKYPSLEKVVGLELDQQVTRSSYKYFGTQPHWDNEKVEWWFGDATKSLLMLPKEYFGSFDMVLVDLSETVMALSVTDELDVMEALALLIKPNGILVKNEYMYMLSQAEIFKHTLHVHYYHVPVVCSQSLILGSNGVDFMQDKFVDHGVDHLYPLLDDENIRYSIVRDYQKNETARQNYCKNHKPEPEEQIRSPGIMMLVDIEEPDIDLADSEKLLSTLVDAVEKVGLSVVSAMEPSIDDENGLYAMVLREGYIVARTWPAENSCALDIHLWSGFEMQDQTKKMITSSLGSTLFSAYRIVAGGMFGVDSWKEDRAKNGPHLDELCTPAIDKAPLKRGGVMDPEIINASVKKVFDFVMENDIKVAAICPYSSCAITKILEDVPKVGEIIEMRACADVVDGVEFSKDASDILFSCEKELRKMLLNASDNSKIDAIVVDEKAPYAFGQIVLRLFRSSIKEKRWLSSAMTVICPIMSEKDAWKKVLVENFRRHIYLEEPVFEGDVVFTKEDSTFTLSIASSGDTMFAQSLVHLARQMENATGVAAEVNRIRAGEFIYQDPFVPDRDYVHADYNRTDPYKQWLSQEPLGFQTIFQLQHQQEATQKLSASRISDMTMAALAQAGLRDSDSYAWKQVDFSSSSKSNGVAGEGSIIFVLWNEGSLVVVWDGRIHVDVSLFTYSEDFDLADSFINSYPDMKTTLRDEQPRGKGRVVNFVADLPENKYAKPYWMA